MTVVAPTQPLTVVDSSVRLAPRWQVVLLDDDQHTYDYVVEMLMELFRHPLETAYTMACEVDATGRVIVDTTTRERAELKQQQIHAYGPDPRLATSRGAMRAELQPSEP